MSPEQQFERSMLSSKDREELHTIASAVGVKAATRMRKADLIDAILDVANGDAGPASGASMPPGGNGSTDDADDTPKPRRVRSARASELADDDPIAALAEEENALAATSSDDDLMPRPRAARRTEQSSAEHDQSDDDRTPTNGSSGSTEGTGGGTPARSSSGTSTSTARDHDRGGSSGAGDREEYGPDGNRRGRRRRRGRGGQEPGGGGEPRVTEFQGEPIAVQGLLDLRDEGYGFLRSGGYLPAQKDVYVSASQVRRFALRRGDFIRGTSRPQASNEKYPALLRVDDVNGMSTDEARERPKFEDLTPLFPDSKLRLEMEDDPHEITGRIVDLISPIGKGQRGLIVSPPKAGKTTILKQLVFAIERNNPETHLMVLLVDERPEEVTDMKRHVLRGEVVASTFDRPADEHTQVAELAIERAKRLVELGTDVVIVLDGITRLARAYNLSAPTSGRIMSGGVDSTALYPPKKFFGAARNIEEGGSLTIIATALIETGSRMDEVIFEEFKGTGNMELRLDRRLSERRIYPSIDVEASSTRHEELLFDRQQLQQVWKLRRVLNALEEGKGLELLIDKIRTTKSNDEFLSEIAKAPTPGG
jgi:transcription termination factor Rho